MHDLQAIIDGLPGIYLIVAADAEYTMVASSDERLRVTMTRREDVIGKPLFEVFSDHEPEKPSSGAATLRRSLEDVIATGQTHSVRDFLEEVFGHLDLDYNEFVEIDPQFFRPIEVDALRGNSEKARRILGWEPRVSFSELARLMTEHDLEAARAEAQGLTSDTPN